MSRLQITIPVYKEQFTKSLNTMIKDEMSGPPPDIVANTVMKLLRIKKPPVRVVVGIKYKIIVFLKRILPARFVEYVVSSIY